MVSHTGAMRIGKAIVASRSATASLHPSSRADCAHSWSWSTRRSATTGCAMSASLCRRWTTPSRRPATSALVIAVIGSGGVADTVHNATAASRSTAMAYTNQAGTGSRAINVRLHSRNLVDPLEQDTLGARSLIRPRARRRQGHVIAIGSRCGRASRCSSDRQQHGRQPRPGHATSSCCYLPHLRIAHGFRGGACMDWVVSANRRSTTRASTTTCLTVIAFGATAVDKMVHHHRWGGRERRDHTENRRASTRHASRAAHGRWRTSVAPGTVAVYCDERVVARSCAAAAATTACATNRSPQAVVRLRLAVGDRRGGARQQIEPSSSRTAARWNRVKACGATSGRQVTSLRPARTQEPCHGDQRNQNDVGALESATRRRMSAETRHFMGSHQVTRDPQRLRLHRTEQWLYDRVLEYSSCSIGSAHDERTARGDAVDRRR